MLDPKDPWSLWLGPLDTEDARFPCARLGAREVCAGMTLGSQQRQGLRLTIEDIQQGRVVLSLVAHQQPDVPVLKGTARIAGERGGDALLSPALCEGAKLHVRVSDGGGTRDVAVKVYLVRPRPDDI